MKYRNRKTGEVVDVISWSCFSTRGENDSLAYIDSKGVEHPSEKGNIYWDYEPVEEPTEVQQQVDWEERLWQLSTRLYCSYESYTEKQAIAAATSFLNIYIKKQEHYESKSNLE